jgi:hypothetical protein
MQRSDLQRKSFALQRLTTSFCKGKVMHTQQREGDGVVEMGSDAQGVQTLLQQCWRSRKPLGLTLRFEPVSCHQHGPIDRSGPALWFLADHCIDPDSDTIIQVDCRSHGRIPVAVPGTSPRQTWLLRLGFLADSLATALRSCTAWTSPQVLLSAHRLWGETSAAATRMAALSL